MTMVKVRPIEDDISIVSFNYDDVKIGNDKDGDAREEVCDEKGDGNKKKIEKKKRSRVSRFFSTWTSTVPEAVGVTGLRYITSSQDSILRRFVWYVAIFGGMGALFYQATDRAVYFVGNYKTVDVDIEYVSELVFPAITICNYNTFRNLDLDSHPFGQMLSEISSFTPIQVNYTHYAILMGDINTTELYLSLAHVMDQNEMFQFGTWDGFTFITPQVFTRVITDFGVCHTFNGGFDGEELRKVKVAGKGHGLSLLLDVQQYHYYYSKLLQYSAGLVVAIHDRDDIPLVESFGLAIAPGTEARIGIKKRQTNNLPPPYGVCGSRDLKYFSSPYSMHKCQRECLIDYIQASCGCVEPYMAVSDNMTVCNPAIIFSCVHFLASEFNVKDECDCPVTCESTTYTTSLSYSRMPSDFYNQKLLDYVADLGWVVEEDHFLTNSVMLQLYFEEMTTEVITQREAYTFFAFLCDIGGSMGLWLGGSILTIVEIFDHLFQIAFIEGATK
ncbi:acid-sensing ion channel 1C-like [Asterias amurensis]|uniref:acid-sensing ion channel 1C-like n=1 Tax=Asterias amurensis TaxID=7602 RepID=UPI003AB8287E